MAQSVEPWLLSQHSRLESCLKQNSFNPVAPEQPKLHRVLAVLSAIGLNITEAPLHVANYFSLDNSIGCVQQREK